MSLKKQYEKDQHTMNSIDNKYRNSSQCNLIDKCEYDSLLNDLIKNKDENRKDSILGLNHQKIELKFLMEQYKKLKVVWRPLKLLWVSFGYPRGPRSDFEPGTHRSEPGTFLEGRYRKRIFLLIKNGFMYRRWKKSRSQIF